MCSIHTTDLKSGLGLRPFVLQDLFIRYSSVLRMSLLLLLRILSPIPLAWKWAVWHFSPFYQLRQCSEIVSLGVKLAVPSTQKCWTPRYCLYFALFHCHINCMGSLLTATLLSAEHGSTHGKCTDSNSAVGRTWKYTWSVYWQQLCCRQNMAVHMGSVLTATLLSAEHGSTHGQCTDSKCAVGRTRQYTWAVYWQQLCCRQNTAVHTSGCVPRHHMGVAAPSLRTAL
jgi:hypothetical protein